MTSLVATELTDRQRPFRWWTAGQRAFLWATNGGSKTASAVGIDKTAQFDRYPGAMDTFRRTMEAMEPYGFL